MEIDPFCQRVLRQRQADGWLNPFPIYEDITQLRGCSFRGTFDVLCGGFPCQAFSHAARGRNLPEKNLWQAMARFIKEAEAPIVFAENVTLKAIGKAAEDLKTIGYKVSYCKLSCGELGGDHRRDRYWLLAVSDENRLVAVNQSLERVGKMGMGYWVKPFPSLSQIADENYRKARLKAVGNAQSPIVAAMAFRLLVKRYFLDRPMADHVFSTSEIEEVYFPQRSWIKQSYGDSIGYVHTPTTMANYTAPSMMKHSCCRSFARVFGKPTPSNAEYLMGLPMGASSPLPMKQELFTKWVEDYTK